VRERGIDKAAVFDEHFVKRAVTQIGILKIHINEAGMLDVAVGKIRSDGFDGREMTSVEKTFVEFARRQIAGRKEDIGKAAV
jgi:hypothetical protein